MIIERYKEVFDVIFYYVSPWIKLIGAFALVRLIVDLSYLAHVFRKAAESVFERDGGKDNGDSV